MRKEQIVIGSRESRLAVIQSEQVKDWIEAHIPQSKVRILTMKTAGDKILNQSLESVGGKGLFVKELDNALHGGNSDISVHSLKDVPMELPESLPLVAFSKREDPRDVLVLPEGCTEPDFSKPVGCSSKRRMVQFQKLYPQAKFALIRGNVQTRLRRLDEGEFCATLLAAAGLKRLGLEERISRYFSPEEMIPAAGQGILAVQGRAGEDYSYLEDYNDREAQACALAERAFVRGLGGGCSEPIGAYAYVKENVLYLRGFYQDERTQKTYTGTMKGSVREPEKIGKNLAKKLLWESKTGKVWLVGAGPSDAGLLTVKGKEVLEQAEVVVYDALVGASILAMLPEGAEAVNVGKRSGHHLMRQEEISELLAKKALEGKRVVRLKGGDPFLFGRGGEELEALVREHIPYEVVPGVTSAIAVPAYQGIPVTHRDYCSSVHIITGHRRQGEYYDIDFEALVRTKGTLVFLMGVSSLSDICKGLLDAKMDKDMPAAFLAKGTTAAQQKIVATVSTLEAEVKKQGAITPAIIVVGEVCRLSDEFSWVDKLPLSGVRVLVTRPKELCSTTAGKLCRLGAEVLELPAIKTVKRSKNQALKEALLKLETYQWVVFTSPTGVRVFFEEMAACKVDVRSLGRVKFAVIGSGSLKELEKRGFYADLMPKVYDAEHLGEALSKVCSEEISENGRCRVLIARAALGSKELTDALSKVEGLLFEDIASYDTVYGEDTEDTKEDKPAVIDVKTELESVDYVIFTSASTVKGFAAAAGDIKYETVKAVCIGRQTKEAADAFGMQTWTSPKASIDSLIETLLQIHRTQF